MESHLAVITESVAGRVIIQTHLNWWVSAEDRLGGGLERLGKPLKFRLGNWRRTGLPSLVVRLRHSDLCGDFRPRHSGTPPEFFTSSHPLHLQKIPSNL